MSSPCSLLRIEELQGKGRSVIASQPLKAGQVILRDSPILLYSTLPLIKPTPDHHHKHNYCSNCFTVLSSTAIPCPSCSLQFCTPNCRSDASTTSHTPYVCQGLLRLRLGFPSWSRYPEELQVQARFLVAAYNLSVVSPSQFRTLLSLRGEGERVKDENDTSFILHSVIASLCPPVSGANGFNLETTAALLTKDKLNAFGLMEPFGAVAGGSSGETSSSPEQFLVPILDGSGEQQRSVRAYGIYPNACMFNHDCLPNACRFDYIDRTPTGDADSSARANTDIVIRMIHDVPEGREICLSYFPVNLNYRQRQFRLRDDYGFVCSCDRCQVEANWSDDDGDRGEEEEDHCEDEVAMDEDGNGLMEDEEDDGSNMVEEGHEKGNDFPHAYFFLKYMCTRQNCWGTLAPLPSPHSSSMALVMECNVCGNLKNDELEV